MDYSYKKILPEDVFVSINGIPDDLTAAPHDAAQYLVGNKRTGVELLDMFAYAMWRCPFSEIRTFAERLGLPELLLAHTIRALSGIGAVEWRNRYILLAMFELLEYSELNMIQIAERLNFPNSTVFSKFFKRHVKCTPLEWRFRKRGFHVNKMDIMAYKLKQYEARRGEPTDTATKSADT